MKISLLTPSRNRADVLRRHVGQSLALADSPGDVEVVVAIDGDDPMLDQYFDLQRELPAIRIWVRGGDKTGYAGCGVLWERCAGLSYGDVLLLYNDDMVFLTPHWDTLYHNAIAGKPLIATCDIVGNDSYKYACVAASRVVYEKIGGFTFGHNGSIDRCYEAMNRHYPCAVHVPVQINHLHAALENKSRDEFYTHCIANWGAKNKEWDDIGRAAAIQLKTP